MTQYGFFIDLSRCIGCNACMIACKEWHNIDPGPAKWMRVYQWEKGAFPDIEVHTLPMMCMHCENPVCAEACPNKAISKDEKYGAVLVDDTKCTGQRRCFEACPYGAPQFADDSRNEKMSKCNMCIDRLEQGLKPICVLSCSMRALEFGPLAELKQKYGKAAAEFPADYAPCRIACPAGVDAGNYIQLISAGRLDEALKVFRETTPLTGVLGRVCFHPCEIDCHRGQFDETVSIGSLKRFIADDEIRKGRRKAQPVDITRAEKVGIIGSGPAGLSAAYDLIRLGYQVTVFEAEAEAGGMLRYGIPEYRLPKNILNNEIDYIRELGVEIKTSSPVKNIQALFDQGYQSVFVGTGAWKSQKLNVPGEEARGVVYAVEFLKQVNSQNPVRMDRRVAVIGGGSVAIDAARTALRLGAQQVHLICLECRDLTSKDRMPAQAGEILEAEAEGVAIHGSQGVHRILVEDSRIQGVETMFCISVRNSEGAFAPRFDECSLDVIPADQVIVATGQTTDTSAFTDNLRYSGNSLVIDPVSLEISLTGVFAGGDLSGAGDVINAIAAGKQAAVSIDRYLRGIDLKQGRQPLLKNSRGKAALKTRPAFAKAEFPLSFAEAGPEMTPDIAREQALRCLQCGVTVPSVVFKPEDPKKQIVPWDARKALNLWQKRHPDNGEALPDVFTNIEDVIEVSKETYLRGKLVLKPENAGELLDYTTDDE